MGLTGIAAEDEETANIDIRGVEDDVEDRGNDGMLDFLTITVRVHVQNDDTYMIYGTLECPRSTFITTHNASYLPEGDGVLSLKFPGEKIYDFGTDGPYKVKLSITDGPKYIKHTHTTSEYSYEDFDPARKLDYPDIILYNGNLTVEFESVIQKPAITFSPTPMKDKYRFQISFDQIVGFADDGNGIYTENDTDIVRGDLSQSIWDWSIYDEGSIFRLGIVNTIDLWDVKEMMPVATVIIEFNFNTNIQGTYKKFDIDMKFSEPIEGVDFFTLVQTLEDLTDMTEFNVKEEEGRVQFINGDNEEMAYYEWIKEAESYSGDSSQTISLSHYHIVDGQVMTLHINYPYSTAVDRIFHDPKIGIKALPIEPSADLREDADHSIILFGFSLIVGGLFIAYTIHAQRKRG